MLCRVDLNWTSKRTCASPFCSMSGWTVAPLTLLLFVFNYRSHRWAAASGTICVWLERGGGENTCGSTNAAVFRIQIPVSRHFVMIIFAIMDNSDSAIRDKGCIITVYGFFGVFPTQQTKCVFSLLVTCHLYFDHEVKISNQKKNAQ